MSRSRERLRGGFRFAVPGAQLVEDLVDKRRFQALADRLDLPVPESRQLTPADAKPGDLGLGFPVAVKPVTRWMATWAPIAGLEPICVAGNHDLMALGELSEERCIPLARRSMGWTRKVLSDDARAYLASLPRRAEAPDGVVVAHGSLNDPEEYVLRADQAAVQIGLLAREHPGARILVVGHTHRAFASDGSSTPLNEAGVGDLPLNGSPAWLLNPGAVGQSRERRALARFMLLDLERGQARFHAIPYDIERAQRMLRRRGLPARSYHLYPTRWKAWSRPVRRLLPQRRVPR